MPEHPEPAGEFVCDQCGACCKGHLIVGTEWIDIVREPRLIDADPHWRGKSVREVVNETADGMKMVILACGSPCSFLGGDNLCTIYPTRPNDCVAFEAGSDQCQEARDAAGLPPLLPIQPDIPLREA